MKLALARRWFLVGVGVASAASASRADETSDVLRAISTARTKVSTVVARFAQVRVLSLFASSVESTGELTLVRQIGRAHV